LYLLADEMDQHIVYSKELTKADILVLKNLHADIHDVAAKPISDGNGMTTNGSSPTRAQKHSFC
jgi:hypothetical protein